ncbi:hypothetical protein CFK41_02625 [Brachybacterium ginsengisoli]|uniref:Uncharacterized protein n=1 Tax=Brachybacterium ginsengisoli TaxID=1331682 RepID=A0A291GU99_9MICO|nr:hypothetical protein CFK41_02625 [Brachybacterium ginsengisoli]
MLNGSRLESDPFPAQCEVRGCTRPPGEWFSIDSLSFDVCRDHDLELRAGEPYATEGEEILVGRDCTGDVLGVRLTGSSTSETAVIRLGRRGVTHQEVRLDSCTDLPAALSALRALDATWGGEVEPDGA